jgi:hypothetical protein
MSATLREGAVGDELCDHWLRAIGLVIAGGCYATATPEDRLAYENGMLRGYLRQACQMLEDASDEPVDLDAIAADNAQDWKLTDMKESRA